MGEFKVDQKGLLVKVVIVITDHHIAMLPYFGQPLKVIYVPSLMGIHLQDLFTLAHLFFPITPYDMDLLQCDHQRMHQARK